MALQRLKISNQQGSKDVGIDTTITDLDTGEVYGNIQEIEWVGHIDSLVTTVKLTLVLKELQISQYYDWNANV